MIKNFLQLYTVEYWQYYLLPNGFILYSDHEALKFINGQHALKPRHAKWVETLQAYSFVIRHKVGASNIVADALNRQHALLSAIHLWGNNLTMGPYFTAC